MKMLISHLVMILRTTEKVGMACKYRDLIVDWPVIQCAAFRPGFTNYMMCLRSTVKAPN